MSDLTQIDVPFGELPQETQWALKGAHLDGQQIEVGSRVYGEWQDIAVPRWLAEKRYRLKPTPAKTHDTFDVSLFTMPNCAPILSGDIITDEGWHAGKAIVEFEDNTPVRLVWEAAK